MFSSFCFIWIPMLWVYGHFKYFTLSVRGSTLDDRLCRLKSVPALKGLMLGGTWANVKPTLGRRHVVTTSKQTTLTNALLCWTDVVASEPTLNHHSVDVLCLLCIACKVLTNDVESGPTLNHHWIDNALAVRCLPDCWTDVVDGGPTFTQHWVDVLCYHSGTGGWCLQTLISGFTYSHLPPYYLIMCPNHPG